MCKNLTNLTISEGLETIGASAFVGAGFTKVVLPNSVTKISQTAFNGCFALKEITLPNQLETIGQGAFSFSALVAWSQ